jgi:hypothetical protein
MALDNLKGVTVASGTWLYDGVVPQCVLVLARNYDVDWSTYEAEGWLEEGQQPAEPGPDGLYYYVSGTGPFKTLAEAKTWTEESWGPVAWDG